MSIMTNLYILPFSQTDSPITFESRLGGIKIICDHQYLMDGPIKSIDLSNGSIVTVNKYLKLPSYYVLLPEGNNVFRLTPDNTKRLDIFIQHSSLCSSDGIINKVTPDVNFDTVYKTFSIKRFRAHENLNISGVLFNTSMSEDSVVIPMHEIVVTTKSNSSGIYQKNTQILELTNLIKNDKESVQKALYGDIITPFILDPPNDAVNVEVNRSIHSSMFESISGDLTHTATRWEIYTDPNLTNEHYSITTSEHLMSLPINDINTTVNTTYYVRCKYYTDNFESTWSTVVKFSTAILKIRKPSVISPANWETNIIGKSFIETDFYKPIYHNEPHVSTDWQIATDSDFTNIVYESLEDIDHLTSIGPIKAMKIESNSTYYVRCRYRSESYLSEWSNVTKFITEHRFDFEEVMKLIPQEVSANDQFGYSCSISEDTTIIAIGALYDDDNGSNSGSVYIFRWNETTSSYEEIQKIVGVGSNVYFGFSTALSNDGKTLLIGAIRESSSAGAVHMFKWSTEFNSFVELQLIVAGDRRSNSYFGSRINLSPDESTLIISAYAEDSVATNNGAVYIFKYNDTSDEYEQTQKILSESPIAHGHFGFDTAISTDCSVLVIGEYNREVDGVAYAGNAYVYKFENGSFIKKQDLSPSDKFHHDFFGVSVDISEDKDTIVIGAYRKDIPTTDSGCVYVFKLNTNNDLYEHTQLLTSPKNSSSAYFGRTVKITKEADMIFVGAYYVSIKGKRTGHILTFSWDSTLNLYVEKQQLCHSDAKHGDYFSLSFSITPDGSALIASAILSDQNGASNSGSAYLFL
jgi:hypothetical protein